MKQAVHWHGLLRQARATRLEGTVDASVVVVGGGITGLSCAQRLRAAGASVALVERDSCGSGASGRSSGFITPASEIELRSLVSRCSVAEARRIWEFVRSGVEAIRANIHTNRFDCDFQVQDSLFVANDRSGRREALEEHAARLQLGYPSLLLERGSLGEALGTKRYAAGVRYGETFAIDPYAYCRALRELLAQRGVQIFEASPVAQVLPDGVATADGRVRAEHVVVCTDRFIPELGLLEDEIYHAQTFLAISAPLSEQAMSAIFPKGCAMTWDSSLIYHYFRATGDRRILLGGGALRRTYARRPALSLESITRRAAKYFARRFPGVPLELESAWSGMLGVSKDLLPIMAADPRHPTVWYVGAATGLPWGTALGIYAAERILAQRKDFDEAFSPRRKFAIGHRLQSVLRTPLTFAICNGIAKLS
ncbi:MAG TPA: FAD-binding oxidoreductase [Planctomycetota bacterium]|nr:FAD-binding oxidoreductase [Planctomycetota bacterium]